MIVTDINQPKFLAKVKFAGEDECWEWQAGTSRFGYGQFAVKRRATNAHRVAWVLWVGEIPKGKWVLHTCDNPLCVNPQHLYLGTVLENNRDRVERGRGRPAGVRGERHGHAKLSLRQVKKIRREYSAGGVSQATLGKKYGVCHATISFIVNNKTWVG